MVLEKNSRVSSREKKTNVDIFNTPNGRRKRKAKSREVEHNF